MEGDLKIVDFYEWCKTCRHRNKLSTEEPCDECISIPARHDSRKPEKWEAVNE